MQVFFIHHLLLDTFKYLQDLLPNLAKKVGDKFFMNDQLSYQYRILSHASSNGR